MALRVAGKNDKAARQLLSDLYAIFEREREEAVEPVVKEDVAEVLRRRFFTQESIANREGFRQHVIAALKGISDVDEQTRKQGSQAEERLLRSREYSGTRPFCWSRRVRVSTSPAIGTALSQKAGRALPWKTVRDVVQAALQARFVELLPDSGAWPRECAAAQLIRLKVAEIGKVSAVGGHVERPQVRMSAADSVRGASSHSRGWRIGRLRITSSTAGGGASAFHRSR